MLFDEDDAALLKKWIVKRLEDISDADSDVLADYVLALLRHDQDEDQVHNLCLEQLDDFLREHTKDFVRDVFASIKSKSYLSVNSTLSGAAAAPVSPLPEDNSAMKTDNDEGRKTPVEETDTQRPAERTYSAGTKRTYHDRERENGGRDISPHGRGSPYGRGNKAPRRGAMPGGRWSSMNGGGGRGTFRSPKAGHAPLHVEAPFAAAGGMPPLGGGQGLSGPNTNLAAVMNAQGPNPGFAPWDMAAMMAMAGWSGMPGPGQNARGGGPGGPPMLDPSQRKRGQKCRDYMQQGFCMRGQMCPYDHGEDVITVPDYQKSSDEYDPNNAQLLGGVESRSSFGSRGRGGNRGRGRGRAEFSAVGPHTDIKNATIVVESIPEEKLNEADLSEYFSRFGEVKKITTQSYRRLAIIEFEKHDSAKAAHSSPEPIFNNRFIKVFWYRPAEHGENGSKPLFQKPGGGAARGEDIAMGGTEPEFDLEEFQRKQEEAQKAHEAREAKRKAHEEAKKELEKKRIELLAKQAEQKLMMEKLALKKKAAALAAGKTSTAGSTEAANSPSATNGNGTPATAGSGDVDMDEPGEKKEAMTAALKAQLEKLEQEAASLGIDPNAAESSGWEGGATSFRGRGGFRGGFRGRSSYRGAFPSPYSARGAPSFRGAARARVFAAKSLDNRPKRVAIRGLSKDDHKGQEKLREVLFSSGIESLLTTSHPSLDSTTVVIFKARHLAEMFFHKQSELKAFDVKFEWIPNDIIIPEELELQEAEKKKMAARQGMVGNGAGAGDGARSTAEGGEGMMVDSPGLGAGSGGLGRRDDEFEGESMVEEEEDASGWLAE